MKKLAASLAAFVVLAFSGIAIADLAVLDGAGTPRTIKNFVCETTKLCNATVLIASDGTEISPATSTLQTTANTSIGATSESAAGTDTATSGLNGLIKRLLQSITTLNSKIDTLNTNVTAAIPAGTNEIGGVNVTKFAGTAAAVNSGNKDAGTPRVVNATDQPALAAAGQGATGAAPPAGATQAGAVGSGATGGLLAGLKTCDLHAKYDASDNGSITMVTGVSGRKVYICGFILATGGTATNLKLREGSDANCATNGADLTPAYQLVANDRVGMQAAFWTGLAVSTNAYYVCVNASAANAHQAEIWYTIQ